MQLTNTLSRMACYWNHSHSFAAKISLCRYFIQRLAFYCGLIGAGEQKISSVNLEGFTVSFNLRSPEIGFFQEMFLDRVYEQEADFIPRKGRTVLDIGANIGLYALWNSKRVDTGKIICFEPNPLVYPLLQKNIKDNQLVNVEVFPYAIGINTGEVEFEVSPFSSGDGTIMKWRNKNTSSSNYNKYILNMETLDHFAKQRNLNETIDLIKMDIEGAEFEAICGAKEVLKITKRIVMEYHDAELFKTIIKQLNEIGLKCIRILPSNNIAYFRKES